MSIVLTSILVTATVFAQMGPSQGVQGSDDDMMRHLVQYFMRVGTGQYERSYYIEAEKTFRMAQGYRGYLDPLEQHKLDTMLEKASLAAIERRQVLEARQAGERLLADGQAAAARARFETIRDSEFLTEKERAAVAEMMRGAGDSALTPAAATVTPAVNVASESRGGDALERFKNRIANVYYESVKAYHDGDFEKARVGFKEVLRSGLMPATMADGIRGYLAEMNGATPVASVQPMVLPNLAGTMAPLATAATGQPQSEKARMQQLYDRSWELYSQGELKAARDGFAQVAASGLLAAPEGKRPEDYIATIDRLLASTGATAPVAAPRPVTAGPSAEAAGEQGGFIEVINRRRSIIRSHTSAVVTDAINESQKLMAQGKFEEALEPVETARRVINENQLHLGDELYKQYNGQLNGVFEQIANAEAEREKQMAEQKRLEAAEEQQTLRDQAETDRQKTIDELMQRARAYWKQMKYDAALGQIEALLAIDPLHDDGLTLKQQLEDMIQMRKQIDLEKLHDKQKADTFLSIDEAGVPYVEEVRYPKNWDEISAKPTRQPDKPFSLDAESAAVYEQLDTIVDLSILTPEMPLSEAIGHLRNAVQPPINIVVLWRDLLDNAEIEPTTPIDMDGISGVTLSTVLENLLNAVAGGFTQLDYIVNKGVVTCATIDSLPVKEMVTRVYDITDLVTQPANYSFSPMLREMLYEWQDFGSRELGEPPEGGDSSGSGSSSSGSSSSSSSSMGGMGGGMGSQGGGMGGTMGGGIMPTSMPSIPGMGSMMGGMIARSLTTLIEQSIEPDSWFNLNEFGQGTIYGYPTMMPKKLAIYQSPDVHRKIEDLLDQLRKSLGHQVSIEARFLVVSENFLEDIGLDVDFSYDLGGKWGLVTVTQDSVSSAAPAESTRVPGSLGGLAPAANVVGGYGSVLDDLQVSFLLRATQGRTDSKSLAAPKVTVLSGESAIFTLANEVSYALPPTLTSSTTTSVGSGSTSSGVENNIDIELIGSGMSVSPTIMKDKKHVLLNIQATQIDLLGFANHTVEALVPQTGAAGATATAQTVEQDISVPEREVSQVFTRVSVPDNGTLLLGGHKITADIDKEVGVPVLSKIPILGRAFSNRSRLRDHKVLLILVKPTIILQEEKEQEALALLEGDKSGMGGF